MYVFVGLILLGVASVLRDKEWHRTKSVVFCLAIAALTLAVFDTWLGPKFMRDFWSGLGFDFF